MKRFYIILIVLLMVSSARAQWGSSCLPEGITFNTQAQIDSFQVNYPGCIEIEGDVIIGFLNAGSCDITYLSGLSVLTSIGGNLIINVDESLTSLTGLENLTLIGSYLSININYALASLTGLEGLTSIGGGA
jgi:hypothetical protein